MPKRWRTKGGRYGGTGGFRRASSSHRENRNFKRPFCLDRKVPKELPEGQSPNHGMNSRYKDDINKASLIVAAVGLFCYLHKILGRLE